jgi:Glycosyl hydrolase family 53
VRAAQGAGPKIQVSLVIGNGDSNGEPQYFYGNLTNPLYGNVPASSFDIMGVDYYPSSNNMTTLGNNLKALANTYNKKIMVMETDAPWEADSGLAHDSAYAETQAGQASYISTLATTVENLPNGDGMGLLYWYPEAVQVPGYNVYNGGATALFDSSGNAVQAISDFSITQHAWNTLGSGMWSTAANWTNSSSPSGSDVEADFLGAISSSQTITTSSAITLGTLRFQNANTYTLAGTGSLSMQATVGWGYIVVQQGAQQINIPTTISNSTILSVAAGSSLTFGGAVTVNSGQILKPSGSGTINYNSSITLGTSAAMTIANSTTATNFTLAAGATATLAGSGTVLQVSALSDSGAIDIGNDAIIINYGSGNDPIASVAAWITSGYANGTWTGAGIRSSAAQSNSASYGIGYADSADPGNPADLPSGTIEILYTLLGDANLDGKVNGDDFTLMATNFNDAITNGWDQGDFNYDGAVNGGDFVLLADNFNQFASQSAVFAADLAALNSFAASNDISLSNIPEPQSAAILCLAAFTMRRRAAKRGHS